MFHLQHKTHANCVRAGGDGQRQKQPPATSETVKPYSSDVGCASVDKDRISRSRAVLSAISLQNLNLIEMSEIVTRTGD